MLAAIEAAPFCRRNVGSFAQPNYVEQFPPFTGTKFRPIYFQNLARAISQKTGAASCV